MDNVPLRILLLIILTVFNAFFASAEIALLQINDAKYKQLAEKGDKKAGKILKLTGNSAKLLSNIQVGVTLSGFLSSAFAADSFAGIIVAAIIKKWPDLNTAVLETVAVILITLVLSYFTLVFGELVPKQIAIKKKDKIAAFSVNILNFTGIIFAPFIKLLSGSVRLVLKLLNIDPNDSEDDVTEEEILLMVNEGQEQGAIDDDEGEMISNIFEFDDKTCRDIVIHRTEVIALPDNCTYQELKNLAINEKYSRIPIYHETIDNIIGVIHIKSLLGVDEQTFDIKNLIRNVIYLPDSEKIGDAMDELKNTRTHLAVVLDEFGGTEGIVTLEDILEELVGNIMDEYDDNENLINKISDDTFIISGIAEIDEINNELDTEIPGDEYSTLSGFVIDLLGEIPDSEEKPTCEYENYVFTVLESNNKVITSVELKILPIEKINEED